MSAADIRSETDAQESSLLRAFFDVVAAILGPVVLAAIVRLVELRRPEDVIAMLRLGPAALSPLTEAIRDAFRAGGRLEAAVIRKPGAGAVVTFDMRNPRAEQWIARHAAERVTAIIEDQRAAIRTVLQAGVEAGRGPRAVALDVVGRMNRAAGRRQGGIVGLTNQQAEFVVNARRELEGLDARYFSRQRRDKRFDVLVRRAIETGKPLSAADIDRITGRYADRLLSYRGEVIARTEAMEAMNAGRYQAYRQAVEAGDVKDQNITRRWKSASDQRVRDSHQELHNTELRGMDAPFRASTGAAMRYPGDTALGAGPEDVIQCRCTTEFSVDWLAEELGG